MPEKRRTRTGSQVKAQRPSQTTLKDLFRRTNSGASPAEKGQEPLPEQTEPVTPTPQLDDAQPPAQSLKPPPKPSQLYPIFTKVPSARRGVVIDLDDTEVIDITDGSSDVEVPTEPPLSPVHQPSPRSEFSQATSHSPPPSPIPLDVPSDTSFPHAGTREHASLHKTSKKSNKRTLGDVVPLPSSCSQHVRGVQHSYTSSQAPLKRRVCPGPGPSDEGTLDCLAKWRQLDDAPSIPSDRIHRSLTPQQCEERIQSLSRNYADAHPAFAQISVQRDGIPSRQAEMWTRRFRPRRANEVLGNERHALYLRDWLCALELHLRGRTPDESVSKNARKTKGSRPSNQVEPRGVKRARVVREVARKRGSKKRRVDSDDDLGDFVVLSDVEQPDDPPEGSEDELAFFQRTLTRLHGRDPPEDSEDELALCQRTLTRLHRRDTVDTHDAHPATSNHPSTEIKHTTTRIQGPQTNFVDKLTNTLLITGPPGCGKTAAVYACAEELGWEVFEVYPGIGKRNGASLDHLVGDVGRNHIVQRRPATTTSTLEVKERMGLRGYLGKKKAGEFAGLDESQEAGTEAEPIDIEGNSPRRELEPLPPDQEKDTSDEAANPGKCHAEFDGSKAIVGQSLVLLEEVDILFKEDAGFWATVVELIRCSQRPVVMTCNDPGLVPVRDLPLQTVLVFEPCPSTVAATFLQCVSLMEGCLVPHEDLMVLYESRDTKYGLDVPDMGDYPRTEGAPLADLRRSITELQMACAGARHGSASEMQPGDEAEGHVRRSAGTISAASRVTAMESRVGSEWWRQMNRRSELMSHVDAELCREGRGEVVREEEEVGYVVLGERGGLAFWERDELIAEEAVRHARGVHEDGTGPSRASINPAARLDAGGLRARVEYRARMVEALEGVLAAPDAVMPQRGVFLDYIPWVGHMVGVDDELERRALCGRGGRCTRNSLRRVHARSVVVGDGAREVLRRSRLGVE